MRLRLSSDPKQHFRRIPNVWLCVMISCTVDRTNAESHWKYLISWPFQSINKADDLSFRIINGSRWELTSELQLHDEVILPCGNPLSEEYTPSLTSFEISQCDTRCGPIIPWIEPMYSVISKLRAGWNSTDSSCNAEGNFHRDSSMTRNDKELTVSVRKMFCWSHRGGHIDNPNHSLDLTDTVIPVSSTANVIQNPLSSSQYTAYLTSSTQDSDNTDSLTLQKQDIRTQDLQGKRFTPNMYHDFSIHSDLPPILKSESSTNSDSSTDLNFKDDPESLPPSYSPLSSSEQEEENDIHYDENEKYPVIYRYFGRSRTRSVRDDSTPYIILCPNVDHFKVVGQILSSRGFHTMICQRVMSDRNKLEDASNMDKKIRWDKIFPWSRRNKPRVDTTRTVQTDGTKLVLAILKVLKWKKAVLIGCGAEAILAIEAALHLAPNRVAGLIVCGDLTAAYERASEFLEESTPSFATAFQEREHGMYGPWSLDKVLHDYIECPSTIIWDGDSTALISSKVRGDRSSPLNGNVKSPMAEKLEDKRSVIIGGGSAPYRKLPEQFSWTCTRFVEKELSTFIDTIDGQDEAELLDESVTDEHDMTDDEYDNEDETDLDSSNYSYTSSFWSRMVPDGMTRALNNMFNPESLVVSGRMIASVVIYLTMARVVVFHYRNAIHGLAELRSSYLSLSTWWQQLTSLFLSCVPVLSKDIPSSNGALENKQDEDQDKDQITNAEEDEEESEEDSTVRKLFFYDQIFT